MESTGASPAPACGILGLRYGMILTAPHGPGFLRGQLEYALDVVPVWVITQKTNTAYGGERRSRSRSNGS